MMRWASYDQPEPAFSLSTCVVPAREARPCHSDPARAISGAGSTAGQVTGHTVSQWTDHAIEPVAGSP